MVRSLLKRIGRFLGRKSVTVPALHAPHPCPAHEHKRASLHTGPAHPPQPTPKTAPPPAAWHPGQFNVPPVADKVRFHDLNLPDAIMHAVDDCGFKYCTPIQALALPPALAGKDVAGQAQTGTGKTAAFLIASMTRFIRNPRTAPIPKATPRALIIAPTRELAIQIERDARGFEYHSPITSSVVFGGMDYNRQKDELRRLPVDILVATPGRLLDFVRSGDVHLDKVEVLVIDEADRMLDMGFIPDVRSIIRRLPPRERRQTLLFSATLSDDILRLASQWMCNAVKVGVAQEKVTVDTVEQIVYSVGSHQKFNLLYNIIIRNPGSRILVFGNRRDRTMRLADELSRRGINCALLSGDVDQKKRLKILDAFRENSIQVLVATDVAGRGIHVDNITHVINYEIPYEVEDYVHRIGRTARAGASGTAITFACEDAFDLPAIEKFIGRALRGIHPPEELLSPAPAAKGASRAPAHAPPSMQRHGGRPGSGSRGRPPRRYHS